MIPRKLFSENVKRIKHKIYLRNKTTNGKNPFNTSRHCWELIIGHTILRTAKMLTHGSHDFRADRIKYWSERASQLQEDSEDSGRKKRTMGEH